MAGTDSGPKRQRKIQHPVSHCKGFVLDIPPGFAYIARLTEETAMIIHKIVTAVTLLSFTLTTLYGPVAYAEEAGEKGEKKAENRGIVTIVSGGGVDQDEGWSIVRLTPIEGRVIVVSEKVGPEIDLTERNYYGIFQGETIYKSPFLQIIQIPVDGFKSATFIQLPDSAAAVKITYGFGDRLRSRSLRIKDKDTLKHIRNYIDHFEEINRGTYRLRGRDASSDSISQYPLYTDQKTAFEETVPFYHVVRRANVVVTRKDGGRVRGEVIPTFDGENILVETDAETQKIPKDDVSKIRFTYIKGGRMMATAVKLAFSGALTGALIGALTAWQTDTSVGQNVVWASSILGAAGFVAGLMSGGRNRGESGGEFTLGPVKEKPKKEKRE